MAAAAAAAAQDRLAGNLLPGVIQAARWRRAPEAAWSGPGAGESLAAASLSLPFLPVHVFLFCSLASPGGGGGSYLYFKCSWWVGGRKKGGVRSQEAAQNIKRFLLALSFLSNYNSCNIIFQLLHRNTGCGLKFDPDYYWRRAKVDSPPPDGERQRGGGFFKRGRKADPRGLIGDRQRPHCSKSIKKERGKEGGRERGGKGTLVGREGGSRIRKPSRRCGQNRHLDPKTKIAKEALGIYAWRKGDQREDRLEAVGGGR